MPYQLFREPHHFFYHKRFGKSYLYVRSARLEDDILRIFNWVNQPYAKRFWQMQGSMQALTEYYREQEQKNITSTFFVCHGTKPIALFEVYQVIRTNIKDFYDTDNADYGIHLLMAPAEELQIFNKIIKKVSEKVLLTIIETLFSFNTVNRIVAEPDSRNIHACGLAEKAGFTLIKQVQLPEKPANLYMITKDEFNRTQG